MKKGFICMQESPIDTQKKIRTWISSGYQIEVITQTSFGVFDASRFQQLDRVIVITSLWRWKDEN